MSKELLEAKRIEEENERKRCTFIRVICLSSFMVSHAIVVFSCQKTLFSTLTEWWPSGKLKKRRKDEREKRFDKNWKKIRS